MAALLLNQFKGIAPNVEADAGFAEVAEGVDLSGGILRGFPAHTLAATGHAGEFTYFDGQWISGAENYLRANIEGAEALISKKEGEWRLQINGSEGPLWINAPSAPTVTTGMIPSPALGAATVSTYQTPITAGTVEYFARYTVMVNGVMASRSPYSAMVQVVSGVDFSVSFTLPTAPPGYGITHVELYRRRSGEQLAGLVAKQDVITTTLDDSLSDGQLGDTVIVDRTPASEYEFQYLICWVRNVGGWEYESAPSGLTSVRVTAPGAKIVRVSTPPDRATAWRIYRISTNYDPTVAFQLVAEVDASVTSYEDFKANADLGAALASQYTSETGALVAAGVPTDQFTGMYGPVNGYYLAWLGEELFLSEPGNPSWWPGAYVFSANSTIIGVEMSGSRIMVVTDVGVQVGYGPTPAQFALNPVAEGEGGVARTAMTAGFYLATDGIYQVTEDAVVSVTTSFSGNYFKDLITTADDANFSLTMRWYQERLFLFHSNGALCFDGRTQNWITFGSSYAFAFTSIEDGGLYGLLGAIIYSLHSGTELQEYQYTFGKVDAGMPSTKFFEAARLDGSGIVHVQLLADETVVTEAAIDMDDPYLLNRYAYFPNGVECRQAQIRILGKGKVKTIQLDIFDAESESR